MQTKIRKRGRDAAPRHYDARDLITRLLESVAQAGGAYTCWGYGGANPEATAYLIDEHLDEATRLANNGLRLVISQCGRGLDDRRTVLALSNLDRIRDVMLGDVRGGLPAREGLAREALEYFRELLLPMTVELSPEQALPPWTLDRTNGLVVDESRARRVRLPRLRGNAKTLIDLLNEHPAGLTNARMKELTGIKAPGRTIRTVLDQHPGLRNIITTPGTNGGRSKEEVVYCLSLSAIAIDAPPSPPTLQSSPKLCA